MKASQLILKELENSAAAEWRPGMSLPIGSQMQMWNTPSNGSVASASTGFDYAIQTTTQIRAKVVDQKFYKIEFAKYMPVIPGEAAWLEEIRTNLVYKIGGNFEQGLINLGNNRTALEKSDVALSNVNQKIALWAKKYDYSIFEVNLALRADNWDVVEGKMKAVKTEWDLGLQSTAFLGLLSDQTSFPGLLSDPNVNINLSVITQNISSMTPTQWQTLAQTIIDAYWENSNHTELPDTFAIPMNDWLGFGAFINPAFPLADSMFIDVLQKIFARITQNPNFVIYPVLYGDQAANAGYWTTLGTQRYCLYRNNPDSLRMDIPIDFILAAPVPIGAVEFEGVGYGQFTSPVILRKPEVLYFDHT